MRFPATLLLAALAFAPALRAGDTYVFDPNHSSVTFTVRHFLAKVPGWFAHFNGQVVVDPADFTRNTVEATVDVGSVDTNQAKRDEHLRTPDFLDAARHPAATFRSSRWVRTGEDAYDVSGAFTLHGVTKEITLKVRYLGQAPGNRGATLTGWEASTTLARADFGIGQPERSIGDTVDVVIHIEARLQKPEAIQP